MRQITRREPSVDEWVQQESAEINTRLPKMVDQYTRLDRTYPSPGGILSYNYTIISANAGDIDPNKLIPTMRSEILRLQRTSPDLAALKKLGPKFHYYYHYANGERAFSILIDSKEF